TVWDTATSQQTASVPMPADWTRGEVAHRLSPDGKTAVLLDGQRNTIRAIELPSGRVAWTDESEEEDRRLGSTMRLSLSPDGRILLHFVRNIERTSDNRSFAGTAPLMRCRVIDPASGKELRRFNVPVGAFFDVSWSPDSKRIALTPSRRGAGRSGQPLTQI